MVSKEQVIEKLKDCFDPELHIDVWTLEIIYGIQIGEDGIVNIQMTFTTPFCPYGPALIKDIENKVGEIIVGESLNFAQKENEIMKEIEPFVKRLENELKLSVHMHPEFMTSAEAEQLQGKNAMHDASAAAIILKSYLDTIRNHLPG